MIEGNAERLSQRLRALVGSISVEGRGRLAVLSVDETMLGPLALHRTSVVDEARQAGFTHVCLELPA